MSDALRVLCVDDEREVVELTETYLQRELPEVVVETATGGSEALSTLDDGDVDCIVSDWDMPEMTGIELLEAVREDHPHVPFILFTGKGSEEVASEAISAGVTDYLQKGGPEQFALLANRIENAVDQWHTEQALQRTRRKLEQLHETALLLREAEETGTVYDHAAAAASEVLAFDICAVVAAEDDHFRSRAMVNFPEDVEHYDLDEGLVGKTYQTGEPQRVDVVEESEAAKPAREDFRSAIAVPIGDHGVFLAVSTEPAFFDDHDLELAELLVAHVRAALDRIERADAVASGEA